MGMRKPQQPLDFAGYLERTFGAGGYSRSDAREENLKAIGEVPVACLYVGRDYPEMLVVGCDEGGAIAAVAAVLPQKPLVVREPQNDRLASLSAFRADSYYEFLPIAKEPDAARPTTTRRPTSAPASPYASRPTVFLRKGSLRPIEANLAANPSFTTVSAILSAAARPLKHSGIALEHPAEFIIARLFMPPRLNVAQYHFAAVPIAVAPTILEPGDSPRFGFDATWSFAGQPLSIRYYVDLPSAMGARAEPLAKAVASGMFKDALAFWGSWKKPIESPSIVSRSPSLSAAPNGAESVILRSEIRGEGMRFPCFVEFPRKMVGLLLRMANVAPLGPDSNPDRDWTMELIRANDRLFIMMKAVYRKPYLANPPGAIQFEGPTLFGLLSLMDDADTSVIVQNFLVPRYELANLPLFCFFHEAGPGQGGEAVYRLKPAVPLSRSDVERYLSEAQRKEWLYHLGKGCPHRITDGAAFAAANREASVALARSGVSGKINLSRKALDILREEVLAPLEAEDSRALADDSRVASALDALKALAPKALSELLMKIDNQALALAALSMPGLDAIVMRGLSQGRQGDLRTECEVMRRAQKRAELSVSSLLEARDRLVGLADQYDDTLEDPLV